MRPANAAMRPGAPEFGALRTEAELVLRQQGVNDGVRLHGGPMTGWYVRQDADVLDHKWYMSWPPSVQQDFEAGHYAIAENGRYAEWTVH